MQLRIDRTKSSSSVLFGGKPPWGGAAVGDAPAQMKYSDISPRSDSNSCYLLEIISEERYTARVSPPPKSVRFVFSGSLSGGEIWSSGFWMHDLETAFNQDTAQALALLIDGLASASSDSGAMTNTMGQQFSITGTWQSTSAYLYNGGSTQAAYVGRYESPTTRAGSQQQKMPNQVCSVVTLRSGLPGRRYRGRMYLPAQGLTLDQAGELPHAQVDELALTWSRLFTEINQSGDGVVSIVSGTGSVATPVSQVTVDNRPDIQRRRANSQAITYRASGQVVQA